MKFSVIIPTYNRADLLGRCLESLSVQTFKDFEVLVCDDGSTDNSKEVAEGYADRLDLTYIWNENWGGPARPRNIGIEAARGEWVCFLDSDDWWTPDKLEACLPYLDYSDIIYHKMRLFLQNRGLQNKYTEASLPSTPIFDNLLRLGNCATNSSVVVRKTILDQVGPVSEDQKFIATEDFELLLRISRVTERFHCLQECYGYYWIGDTSISFNEKWFQRQASIYEHYLPEITDRKAKKEVVARQAYRLARNYDLYKHYSQAIQAYRVAMSSVALMTKIKSLGFMIFAVAKDLLHCR